MTEAAADTEADEEGPDQEPARKLDPMVTAALMLSILWLGGLGSLAGLVLATMAEKDLDADDGRNHRNAAAALILGFVGLLLAAYVDYKLFGQSSDTGSSTTPSLYSGSIQ